MALRQFRDSLEVRDQCCVVCILSHGGEGFVIGRDGNRVYINEIMNIFDNKNCSLMREKPKVLIIQACSGVSLKLKFQNSIYFSSNIHAYDRLRPNLTVFCNKS